MTITNPPATAGATSPPSSRRTVSHRAATSKSPMYRPLAALAGGWALVGSTYLIGIAWVVPPLIVLATASLMRGGQTLLDRIMFSLGLLVGVACLGGLLFSVWPWGLHPVAVGGTAVTALVGVSVATRRQPHLPRPSLGDGLSVVAAVAVGLVVAFPLVTADATTRLSIAVRGEDTGRHLTIFDAVRQLGGYLFFDWGAAADRVYTGMITYPQGSHLLYAMLDNFVRSSPSELGTGLSALDHYLAFVVLGFTVFTLAMVWAAQRLAAPLLNLSRRIVLIGAVSTFVLGSEIFTLVVLGYPSEVVGLTIVAILVATLARPGARTGQAMLLVSSLVVAVGFTYYLFLPACALAVLIWLIRERRRVLRHRWAIAVTVLSMGVALVPPIIGYVVGRQDAALLVSTGLPGRDVLLAMASVVAFGLLAVQARRSGVWRSYVWSVVAVVVPTIALLVIQVSLDQRNVDGYYYTNKMIHLLLCLLALGVGSLYFYLRSVQRPAVPPLRAAATAIPATLLVLAMGAATGVVFADSPFHTIDSQRGKVLPRAWALGGIENDRVGQAVMAELQGRLVPQGTITVVAGDNPVLTFQVQLFLSALQRTAGPTGPGLYTGGPLEEKGRTENAVLKIDAPVLIVADSARTEALANDIKARHPDRDITVARAFASWW